ncbi:MAG: fibronectin type III-like domain-contianing protein, partial [Oscillospiraceae bacterium]
YAENNVLYSFGYGLTYGKIICTSVEYKDGKAVVTAENTSGKTVDDVIQLYIKDYCENAVPNVSLCGFKRVSLAAGKKLSVDIPVSERAFTAVDKNGERKCFGSRFTLYAGTHQPDENSEKLCGTKCVSTEINL